ncbi:MAG: type VI secretion system contractile sheath large subunit, partial [Planctomycetota bacterium]
MSAGEAASENQAAGQAEATSSILEQAISATKQTERSRAEDLLKTLTAEALAGTVTYDKDVMRSIDAAIAGIDAKMSKQLAAIMHHEKFQQLEGSWRGLKHLVFSSETGTDLKIRVLNCTKKEVKKDMDRAAEFDQSTLFKKIYEDEFGMPGGAPYGALIGDYQFTNHPEDIDLLSKISGVAASSFCPFISAADPQLFGFDDWTELSKPRDLAKIFDSVEYTKWKSFRESEDSRFCTLTAPRTLSRLPYGANTKPVEEFSFEEVTTSDQGESVSVNHNEFCWMNTAYVMGAKLTDSFAKTGFCTSIRGVENGGKVHDLPTYVFRADDGDLDLKCPTEVAITDRREKELSDLGFLPLCHFKNTDYSVFFGAQTCQKPKEYDRPEATANAKISARLPYIMAMSRFSHFLKVIARDKIGGAMEAADCEKWLDRWIHNYVSADPNPDAKQRAKYPLKEARVEVTEVPGEPGSYAAKVWMQPWLQMEELTASMRMVAKIPKMGG